jgi:hypothetical protein
MKRALFTLFLLLAFLILTWKYPRELYAGPGEEENISVPSSIPTYVHKRVYKKVWKEKEVDFPIVSATIADVDGDGEKELVTTDGKKLRIVQWKYGRFTSPKEKNSQKKHTFFSWPWRDKTGGNLIDSVNRKNREIRLMALASGDLDDDGKDEILFTGTKNHQIVSGIIRFREKGFTQTLAETGLYLRIFHHRNGTPFLVGQFLGEGNEATHLFRWDGTHIRSESTLPLPEGINLLSAGTYYSREPNDSAYYAFLAEGDLRFYSADLRKIAEIGPLRLPPSRTLKLRMNENGKTETRRIMIPKRIFAGDFNGDGKDEILAILRRPAINMAGLRRVRVRNSVADLVLTRGEIREYWDTQPIFSEIIDQAVGDIDNNGNLDLVLFVRQGLLTFHPNTRLLIYELR